MIKSLNEAIQSSKGEYIIRMDADDISLPNRIKLQYKFLTSNALDICGGHCLLIDCKQNKWIKCFSIKSRYVHFVIII